MSPSPASWPERPSQQVEYTVLVYPRSSWVSNVGPGGNFGQLPGKTGDKLPNGIEMEVQPGRSMDSDSPCWLKITRSPTDLELVWRVQLWSSQSTNSCTAEYFVSGRPVAWELAVEAHEAFDSKWTAFGEGRNNLEKNKSNNGPTSSMLLSALRPVFVPTPPPKT
ncbi:hypothetical protein K438DRAFT_1759151 [Mycena galopus ATCC 62051]|nr:hypothetical protein K438DRAFT_1759151 [Mycena galopus ATCC 62051]